MKRMRRTVTLVWASVGAVVALLALGGTASAADYTVDNFDDTNAACAPDPNPNPCTLRGAITEARGTGVAATIKLLPGTYKLSLAGENGTDDNANGDLDLVDLGPPENFSELTIEGAGPELTTIDATGLNDRLFEIEGSAVALIQGVTMKGGRASTLSDGAEGGAILADSSTGPLVLRNVRFEDNATLYVGGDGGAISTRKREVSIGGATFFNNSSGDFGGAIAASTPFQGGATLDVVNSTFDRNQAQGAGGGAIVNQGDPGSGELDTVLTVINSTFDGNTAVGFGGAIDSFGEGSTTTNLSNVTLTRNRADSDNAGAEAGGALQNGGAAYTVKNSLIAANSVGAGGSGPNCSGVYTSQGGNVTDLGGCGGFVGAGDVFVADPRIGPLSDNGGPTFTVPLLAGSPAIDHTTNCEEFDQRGVARPQGAACDSGAFEFLPTATGSAPPPPAGVAPVGPTGQRAAALKKCKKKKSKAKRRKCKRRARRLPV